MVPTGLEQSDVLSEKVACMLRVNVMLEGLEPVEATQFALLAYELTTLGIVEVSTYEQSTLFRPFH